MRKKEVRYDIYCRYCEHFATAASDDPCNECLGAPDNEDSKVPVNFKQLKPLVNYLLPDTNLPHPGYTRDWMTSMNWTHGVPSDADLKSYFKLGEDGDWWEIKPFKEETQNENS